MTEMPLPSNPSLWRRVTAGYAKLLAFGKKNAFQV